MAEDGVLPIAFLFRRPPPLSLDARAKYTAVSRGPSIEAASQTRGDHTPRRARALMVDRDFSLDPDCHGRHVSKDHGAYAASRAGPKSGSIFSKILHFTPLRFLGKKARLTCVHSKDDSNFGRVPAAIRNSREERLTRIMGSFMGNEES